MSTPYDTLIKKKGNAKVTKKYVRFCLKLNNRTQVYCEEFADINWLPIE